MTLRSFLGLVRRSLWVVLVGLVIAVVGALAVIRATPATYTVESSYLYVSAAVDARGKAINPFLELGNGVNVLVDVVAVSMTDGETVRRYTEGRPHLEYTAGRNLAISAPVLALSVSDSDPDSAFAVLDDLGAEAVKRTGTIQLDAGAPSNALIQASLLTRSVKPEASYVDGIRNGVVVAAAVIALTMAAAAWRDRRRARKERRLAEAERPERETEVVK